MVWVYACPSLILTAYTVISLRYGKKRLEGLPRKEHPLKIFYGAALRIYERTEKWSGRSGGRKADRMIKSLCVKENVEKEAMVYYVKKYALCLALAWAISFLGLIVCIAGSRISAVTVLTRNEYGQGDASYELDVDYKGESETVQINIEERKYTEDEIYSLFEEAYEALPEILKGENESLEKVSEPLELVSDYGEISIYWEIGDTELLSYSGEVIGEIPEGDSVTLNLFAEFLLEEETAIYNFPVTLVSETLSEKELLLSNIMEEIEENNDICESEVELPDNINGEEISFSESSTENNGIWLILALAAVFAILVLYDRKLEEKMKARNDQMLVDFTEIVSKLSLLYEAGLSIYKAWERIVADHERQGKKEERFAYSEMKLVLEKIKSGVSEGEAYEQFGRRCALHPYIKLGNILSRNLTKGSKGMKELLDREVEEAFEARKRLARKKGEEASTKMLLPMLILLGVVLVITCVPSLMSIGL